MAGDITEHWNEPPELINFLIDHMPHVYAVPGNHDLPNHQIEDLHRSAFWTLVQAGKVTMLKEGWTSFPNWNLHVYGYPYGSSVMEKPERNPDGLRLAVVHANVWSSQDSAYPGVSQQEHIDHYHFLMKDRFDSVLFGDNHVRQMGAPNASYVNLHWCNPGPIFRRTTKEKNQTPAVAELFSDGHFEFREIPGNGDRWRDEPNTPEATEIDLRRLTELLTRLGDSGVDYLRALEIAMKSHDVRKAVRQLVGAVVDELKQLAQKTGDRL